MDVSLRRRLSATVFSTGIALAFLGAPPASAGTTTNAGAVYVLANRTAGHGGNAVLVFPRAADGSLAAPTRFKTGGDGTGAGLGSQGAVVLHGDRLFAVNAGSDEVTSFAVSSDGLTLTKIETVSSGGTMPISLTVSGSYLYVLNAGGDGNISGFNGAGSGQLRPIHHSTRPLSASGVGPAEVSFADEGHVLVVTEKNTNSIDTYAVDRTTGLATGPSTTPSSGMTPFGFAHKGDRIIVSEAAASAAGQSSVSSYALDPADTPSVVTASLGNGQSSVCWVVIARHTRYAYVANTGSATISGLRMRKDDSVSLLDPSGVTATTGAGPSDLAVSAGSDYLYSRDGGASAISGFGINGDGSLSSVSGAAMSLPKSSVGIAAS